MCFKMQEFPSLKSAERFDCEMYVLPLDLVLQARHGSVVVIARPLGTPPVGVRSPDKQQGMLLGVKSGSQH